MGADAPIPPFAMSAAAPDGAPPRRICYQIAILVFNLLKSPFISRNLVILDMDDKKQNLYFLNFLF